MCFCRKPKPSLIDLKEYERDLCYYKYKHIPLPPPPCIPDLLIGDWSKEEMRLMEENRAAAKKIYAEVLD